MSQTKSALLTVLIAICSLQYGSSLAKELFPVIGAPGAAAIRLCFASLIMLTVWRPWRTKLSLNSYKAIALYGGSLGLMNLLFYLALARIPLGVAVALEFTGPLAIALLHSKRPIDFLWAFLAIIGILLLLPFNSSANSLDLAGILLALGAGLCWAGYIHFGKKAVENQHEGVISSLGMSVAALIVLPLGIALSEVNIFNPSVLPLAFLVAILSSALPYSLEMMALKKLSAKTFGILMSLEPAWAALMGLIFLKELLSPKEIVAIVAIIIASLGGTLAEKNNAAQQPEL